MTGLITALKGLDILAVMIMYSEPSIHPLGTTALGEPWPPQQPVSIALYCIFITFNSTTLALTLS
jgi:hypothetical protein